MRIVVDKDLCAGHGQCAAVAPEVYDLDSDGYCAVTELSVPAELEVEARRGAASCPERAITVS